MRWGRRIGILVALLLQGCPPLGPESWVHWRGAWLYPSFGFIRVRLYGDNAGVLQEISLTQGTTTRIVVYERAFRAGETFDLWIGLDSTRFHPEEPVTVSWVWEDPEGYRESDFREVLLSAPAGEIWMDSVVISPFSHIRDTELSDARDFVIFVEGQGIHCMWMDEEGYHRYLQGDPGPPRYGEVLSPMVQPVVTPLPPGSLYVVLRSVENRAQARVLIGLFSPPES